MAFDISTLKPDTKNLLFKNLVTAEFMMGEKNEKDRLDEDEPQIIPRKSPYRNESNANFLLHNQDEVVKIMPERKRRRAHQRNNIVEPDKMEIHGKEIERDKAEQTGSITKEFAIEVDKTQILSAGLDGTPQNSKSTNKQKQLQ